MRDIKLEELEEYLTVGKHQFNKYWLSSSNIGEVLAKGDLFDDFKQTMCLAAVEAIRRGLKLPRDINEVSNLFNRRIYDFMLENGFIHNKGTYFSPEIFLDDFIRKEEDVKYENV